MKRTVTGVVVKGVNEVKTKYRFKESEVNLIINALMVWRRQLLEEGRYTDALDDLLIKLCA